jgi:MFS family permease
MVAATSSTKSIWNAAYLRERLGTALLNPIRAFRPRYLPLLMVYFAYGALGLIGVAESFWVKKALTLTPAQLAELAGWLTLPWTVKMVFGELVDSVPIFGSQRRAYVFIGAAFIALGMLLLAGAAGGWLTFASLENLYRLGAFSSVLGVVIQDVAADAMSTEVVERENPDGSPRDKDEVDRELGMVQVLGRLALSFGIFLVAGVAGWIAGVYSYATVFLVGLIIPVISVSGAALITLKPVESSPIDWRILGGGIAYGAFVLALALSNFPYSQEIVFVVSMVVVCAMLVRVVHELDEATKRTIFYAALIIFVYRAAPLVGQGYTWFAIDVLGFDEAFQGTLGQIGAGLALLGMWLFSDAITRRPVPVVLLWLTIVTTILSLPSLGLVLGLADWTERMFGFGARTIAIIDTAATSPFAQLSMIPLLTLTAIYAPKGHRATWFALMASLMNLALVAGQLQTKYLNEIYVVGRGAYENLPYIVMWSIAIGFVVPLAAIFAFGRRLR